MRCFGDSASNGFWRKLLRAHHVCTCLYVNKLVKIPNYIVLSDRSPSPPRSTPAPLPVQLQMERHNQVSNFVKQKVDAAGAAKICCCVSGLPDHLHPAYYNSRTQSGTSVELRCRQSRWISAAEKPIGQGVRRFSQCRPRLGSLFSRRPLVRHASGCWGAAVAQETGKAEASCCGACCLRWIRTSCQPGAEHNERLQLATLLEEEEMGV